MNINSERVLYPSCLWAEMKDNETLLGWIMHLYMYTFLSMHECWSGAVYIVWGTHKVSFLTATGIHMYIIIPTFILLFL